MLPRGLDGDDRCSIPAEEVGLVVSEYLGDLLDWHMDVVVGRGAPGGVAENGARHRPAVSAVGEGAERVPV